VERGGGGGRAEKFAQREESWGDDE